MEIQRNNIQPSIIDIGLKVETGDVNKEKEANANSIPNNSNILATAMIKSPSFEFSQLLGRTILYDTLTFTASDEGVLYQLDFPFTDIDVSILSHFDPDNVVTKRFHHYKPFIRVTFEVQSVFQHVGLYSLMYMPTRKDHFYNLGLSLDPAWQPNNTYHTRMPTEMFIPLGISGNYSFDIPYNAVVPYINLLSPAMNEFPEFFGTLYLVSLVKLAHTEAVTDPVKVLVRLHLDFEYGGYYYSGS